MRERTFELFFPVLERPLYCRLADAPETEDRPHTPGICIVDDEDEVLSFTKDLLETEGYRVFAFNSPVHALELFMARPRDIDLVLTDMVMPVMNGAELKAAFKKEKPSVIVVGMSGYKNSAGVNHEQTMDAFLKKPFEAADLLSSVRRLLGA